MRAPLLRRWLIVLVVVTAVRCGSGDSFIPPGDGEPANLEVAGGEGQIGTVGQRVTDTLTVRVTDSKDRPVRDQRVRFQLIAGGSGSSLIPDTAVTDLDGRARSVWVMGHIAGQQRVEARVLAAGAPGGLTRTFTGTATPDTPDTVFAVQGDGQAGIVGAGLADSLAVLVTDQYGNPISAQTIAWSVPAGQGSVSAASTVTGADGRAAVRRVLGPGSGTQTATATGALPGSPVLFTSTASPGGATRLVKLFGDTPVQVAPVGNRLTDSLVVQTQDGNGNGVSGQSVVWTVTAGGGTVSSPSSITDAQGKAFVFLTLGTTAGPNSVRATSPSLTPVDFSATGIAARASSIANVSVTTQNGTAGLPVPAPPSVRVADMNNNPVQGVTVTFLVTAGGGSVSDGTGSGPSATVATNSSGAAALTSWTLGSLVGANTLTATATGPGINGNPVTFNATGGFGAAAQLSFTVEPSNVVAGASISPAVRVAVQDINGNTVTTSTAALTLGIGANPGGSTLGGSVNVNAVAGVAVFPNLFLNRVGTGYTLTASGGGLPVETSTTFDVSVGPASRLAFLVEPTAVAAGQAITPPVRVQVQDALGNPVLASAALISVAIGSNPGASTLGGTATVTAVAGVATFADLTLNKVATGYTLLATSTGLTGAVSAAFNVGSGTPTTIAVSAGNNQTATVGTPVPVDPAVLVTDVGGNPVAGVQVSFAVASGGGVVVPATPVTTGANGIAAVTSWTLGSVAGTNNHTLTATATGLTGSPVIFTASATPGSGNRLAFTVQPSLVVAGASIAPAVRVAVQDGSGNTVSTATNPITLALGANPGSSTLGGTLTVNAVAGVATFSNLTLNKVGTGYSLTAGSTGLVSATSAGFNVTVGAANKLAFTVQPVNSVAGAVITPAVQVQVRDVNDNLVTGSTATVAITIGTNPGSSTLGGTASVAAVGGISTFSTLTLNKSGTGYTLAAASTGLAGAGSAAFNITFGAAAIVLKTLGDNQVNVTAGTAAPINPTVTITDINSNPVSGVGVTFAVASGGGTVNPTTPVLTNASGVAQVTTWTLGVVAGTNTLTATVAGLPAVTFTATTVPGTGQKLLLATPPPATVQSGVAFPTQPIIQLADNFNNPVTTQGVNVTVTIASGGGTLGGTTTVATNTSGQAIFTNVSIAGLVGSRTLLFASGGFAGVNSGPITVLAGLAATITRGAGNAQTATVNTALPIDPQVLVTDASGNPVSGTSVTFAVASGGGIVVPATAVVTNISGIAIATSWTLGTVAGTNNNTLTATSAGLTGSPVTFTASAIAGAATQLAVNAGNGQSAPVGTAVATPPSVIARDAFNNPVAGVSVTFAVTGGGGAVTPLTPVLTSALGIAAATNWTLGALAGPNTLTATSTPALTGSPVAFTATGTAGAATRLAFGTQPANATAAPSTIPTFTVLVQDASGNTVPGATHAVTIAVGANPGGSTPGGTLTVNAVAGVATFSTVTLNRSGAGYTLTASSVPALTGATSAAFNVTAGAANRLAFISQPSTVAAGAAIAPAVTLQIQDVNGNQVTTAVNSVTLALGANPGGSVLGGTTTVTAVAGLATFSTLTLNKVGTAYTLTATSVPVLTGVTSAGFNVNPGPAATIVVSAGNSQTATAGTAVATAPAVLVRDANLNPVSGVSVTFAVTGGGGTVNPTTAILTNALGLATVTTWTLGTTAGINTLTATSTPALTGSPVTFTATGIAGTATQIAANGGNAQTAVAGQAVAVAPSVIVRDAGNNPVAGVTVTFAVVSGGGSLTGASTTTSALGIATVGSWTLGTTAGANSISATATGPGITGNPVSFTATGIAGAATKLGFGTQPANATAAPSTIPTFSVRVQDVNNNTVPGATNAVTVAIGNNPGGSTPGGTLTVSAVAGVATFSAVTLNKAGLGYTLTASSVPVLTGTTSTGFNVSAGPATTLALSAGNAQTATAGSPVPIAPAVLATDVNANPVAGVSVTFAVASGGGSLTGGSQTTGTNGIATVGSWTLGAVAGANTLTATSTPVLGGSPVTFTATGNPGTGNRLALTTQPSASVQSGVAFPVQPVVQLQDDQGNPVSTSGVIVSASILTGGGALGGTTTATTGATGLATFTNLAISGTVGSRTLLFSSASTTSVTSNAISVAAGPAATITLNAGNGQTATVNTALPIDPQVLVRDASGNPVSGVTVTFAVTGGGGSVVPPTAILTDGLGLATVTTWTLGTTAGTNTLTATSTPALTGSPVTFTATGTAGVATQIAVNAGNGQSAVAGAAVAIPPSVIARDAFNNPVAGVSVTFAVTGGGGAVAPLTPVLTSGLGIAATTSWTMGTVAGINTLTATSTPALAGSPVTFTATGTAGAATRLSFGTQPANATAAPSTVPTFTVRVQDANGNTVPGATHAVTIAIGTNPGGSTPGGTLTVNAAAGVATFSTVTLNRPGGGYTLTASSVPILTGAASAGFNITAGAANRLAFGTQPANATAAPSTVPTFTVLVQDASGNTVPGATHAVTIAIGTNPGGSTPGGTLTVNAVAGVATFSAMTLNRAGTGYTLTASSVPALTGTTSAGFNVTAGPATTIAASAGTGQSATVGTVLPIDPQVLVTDASGNPVSGVSVTFAVTGGGGTVVPPTAILTDVAGHATVTTWTLGAVAGTNTLTATSTPALAGSPVIFTATGTAGAATQLTITTQPSSAATSGSPFAQQPAIQLRDGAGNAVSQAGVVITAAVASGGGTLGGTLTATTGGTGLATFTNLQLTGLVGARTLSFSSGGLTPATSGSITLSAGAATTIALNAGNGQTATVNTALPIDPQVLVRDASGNPVSGVSVTFAVTGGGGTVVPPTAILTDGLGLATVTTWTLGTTAGTNTLTATSTPALAGSPVAFTATGTAGAATRLAFGTQPANATAAPSTIPTFTVLVQDASGNTVPGATHAVTLAIGTNPGGSTPGGTLTVNAVAGVATFSTVTLNRAGTGYTLTASSVPALTGATSGTFNVTAGPATTIAASAGTGQSATVGTVLPIDPQVLVTDASGNPVSGVSVTFAVTGGGGTVVPITAILTDGAGHATVTTWTLGAVAGPNTLSATSTPALAGSPVAFTATGTAGAATQIALNAGNGQSAAVGTAVTTPPSVIARDAFNNPVAGVSVTFAVTGGAGAVTPLTPVLTSALGIAAATSWTLGTVAGINTLTATSTPVLTGSPVAFTATGTAGAANRLAFGTQPANATAAPSTVPTFTVLVQDASGNTVPGATHAVTIAIGTNPGGSTPGGTLTVNAVAGVATFSAVTLNRVGTGYTLTASSVPALTGTTSAGFNVTAGAANRLAFGTQPANATAAPSTVPTFTVLVQDVNGNTVPGATHAVTIAIGTNPGGSTPGGTLTVNAVAGVATFSTVTLNRSGTGYTLTASSVPALTGATSGTFNVTAGAATTIALNAGNGQSATVNTALPIDPQVLVTDASGNPVTGVSVTFVVTGGGGAVVPPTAILTDGAGLATVTTWTLGTVAGLNNLTATSTPALTGSPVAFTATGTAGAATQIALNAGNGQSASVGAAVTTPPSVIARDAFNNPVAGVSVTFAVTGGGGSVTPLTPVLTSALGIAAATTWTLGAVAGPNTLTATSTPALTGSPVTFTATGTAGGATKLAFGTQPANATAAPSTVPTFTVLVQDASGNTVPGATHAVTIAIGTNPGGSTPGGTLTVNAVAGVATFSTVTLNRSGTGYTLTASSVPALTGATSGTFNVTAGAANRLAFGTQPANATAAPSTVPTFTVLVQDASGNTVPGATHAVTIAIGTNPGGSTPGGTLTVNAVAGVATFSAVTLNRSGTGYTLTASSVPALTGTTSAGFNVTAGAATTIALNAGNGQSAAVNTALPIDPQVLVTDASGNPVSGVSVTFAVTGGGGSVVPTTAILTDGAGLATVTTWTMGTVAGLNTLTATSTPALTGSPVTFTATGIAGAATQLAFGAQPANATAAPSTVPTFTVLVQDASGNTVPGATHAVTIAIGTNPGGSTPGGTLTVNAVAGVATFSTVTLNRSGTGYTLTASSVPALTGATSGTFNVTAGAANRLAFGTQPANATAAPSTVPTFTVLVQDASGNTVPGATHAVTIAIGTNPGGSTPGGTLTVNAVAGVATFSTVTLNRSGTGYTLTASSVPVLTGTTSAGFNVTAGAANRLAFGTQPANATAAPSTVPTFTVLVQDVNGNTVPGATHAVTIAIGTNPGGSTPGGTLTVNEVAGVATFSTVTLNRSGTGYTLTASSVPALTGATSGTFNVTAGAATTIALNAGNGQSAAVNTALPIDPQVLVTDASGNPVTGVSVTFAVTGGGGAVVPPTAILTDGAGLATVTTWTLGTVAGLNTLTATSTPALTGSPVTFTATGTAGAASQLTITTPPSSAATSGTPFAQQPAIQLRDASNNLVSQAGVVITAAVASGAGTLGGTLTATTGGTGLATFTNLQLTGLVGARTLSFSSGVLTPATSGTVTLSAGAATTIAASAGTGQSATVGTALPIDPQVLVTDASGNPVTGVSVTFAVTGGGGSVVPTTAILTDGAGHATVTSWTLGTIAGTNTLTATSTPALTGSPVTFTATGAAGAATQLAFGTQPANATAAPSTVPTFTVLVQDASGNTVPGATHAVTIAIGTNPGGSTPGGTLTVNAVAGVATFSTVTINRSGTGYTLTASSVPALTGATSGTFNVTAGAANRLAFGTQPANATAAPSTVPTFTVLVQDASGNTVPGATHAVTIAIGTNPGGSTPGGTLTVNAVAGVATFSTVTLSRTGTGYTLTASSVPALTGTTSTGFNVTAGAATTLAFGTQPANATAAPSTVPTFTVLVQDASGNTVPGATHAVTIAIGTNPGGSTPGGTLTVNAVAGVATFSAVTLNRVGTGYTLTASSVPALTGTTSAGFNVTAGAANRLAFGTQPANATAAPSTVPTFTVLVQDASGNTVPGATHAVTIAIGTNPGGSTPGGTLTVNAVAGVATFSAVTLNRVGTGYTLTATSVPVLTGTTSAGFNVTAGAATTIALNAGTGQSATVGTVLPIDAQVLVTDASGNPVVGVSVTFAVTGGSGTVVPTTAILTDGAGQATVTSWTLGTTAGINTLTATSTPALTGSPVTFTATGTAGAATQLAFGTQPANATAAPSTVPAFTVLVQDASGNTVPGATHAVTIAIGTNPGGSTPGGTLTVNAVAGVATFSTVTLNRSGTGYTLTASSVPALTGATSGAFNVSAGAATALAFGTQPTNATAAPSTIPTFTVVVQDASGNTVTSATDAVTIAIGTDAGPGATLGGTLTVNAAGGVATFSDITIDVVGAGYTLSASSGSLTVATSTSFDIN